MVEILSAAMELPMDLNAPIKNLGACAVLQESLQEVAVVLPLFLYCGVAFIF